MKDDEICRGEAPGAGAVSAPSGEAVSTLPAAASPGSPLVEAQTHERQKLALDALAKLTRQFSARPDFDHLVNVILMTLCGQFTVANSFAALKKPKSHGSHYAFYATGRFKTNAALKSLCVSPDAWNLRRTDGSVYRIRDLHHLVGSVETISALGEADVAVVCQIANGDRPLGMIGLGRKVSGRAFTARDLGMVHAVVNTITPLIVNTYMFWEMVSLNAQYLGIINSVRQGIFVFDREYRLRRVNSAGLEIIGQAADRAGSFIEAPIEQVFPGLVFAGWARQFKEAMATKRPFRSRALAARARGTDRLYNVSLSSSGESPASDWTVIVTVDDVTSQKEAEHRMFDLQQVAQGGAQSGDAAGGAPDVLGKVAAGLENIRSALASGDVPEAGSVVAELKSLLDSQGYIATGPADEVESGPGMQRANLNSLVTEVLSFVTLQNRFRRLAVTPELDFSLPDMVLSPDQIVLLLLNLLSNSVDAIAEAGRPAGHISVRTSRDGGDVLIAVSDDGGGVKPEVRAKLFSEQVTTKPRGRGCGLVTCRKIIANHKGQVSVESHEGQGTTIIVRLPITTSA